MYKLTKKLVVFFSVSSLIFCAEPSKDEIVEKGISNVIANDKIDAPIANEATESLDKGPGNLKGSAYRRRIFIKASGLSKNSKNKKSIPKDTQRSSIYYEDDSCFVNGFVDVKKLGAGYIVGCQIAMYIDKDRLIELLYKPEALNQILDGKGIQLVKQE
ncbi:MAG: hypothetical protein KAH32_02355 [Chlamydiia bacterium]|nr:hypothetical protein [Chlamydiia bacterium]